MFTPERLQRGAPAIGYVVADTENRKMENQSISVRGGVLSANDRHRLEVLEPLGTSLQRNLVLVDDLTSVLAKAFDNRVATVMTPDRLFAWIPGIQGEDTGHRREQSSKMFTADLSHFRARVLADLELKSPKLRGSRVHDSVVPEFALCAEHVVPITGRRVYAESDDKWAVNIVLVTPDGEGSFLFLDVFGERQGVALKIPSSKFGLFEDDEYVTGATQLGGSPSVVLGMSTGRCFLMRLPPALLESGLPVAVDSIISQLTVEPFYEGGSLLQQLNRAFLGLSRFGKRHQQAPDSGADAESSTGAVVKALSWNAAGRSYSETERFVAALTEGDVAIWSVNEADSDKPASFKLDDRFPLKKELALRLALSESPEGPDAETETENASKGDTLKIHLLDLARASGGLVALCASHVAVWEPGLIPLVCYHIVELRGSQRITGIGEVTDLAHAPDLEGSVVRPRLVASSPQLPDLFVVFRDRVVMARCGGDARPAEEVSFSEAEVIIGCGSFSDGVPRVPDCAGVLFSLSLGTLVVAQPDLEKQRVADELRALETTHVLTSEPEESADVSRDRMLGAFGEYVRSRKPAPVTVHPQHVDEVVLSVSLESVNSNTSRFPGYLTSDASSLVPGSRLAVVLDRMILEKAETHLQLLAFLKEYRLYQRLQTATVVALEGHGEMLAACFALRQLHNASIENTGSGGRIRQWILAAAATVPEDPEFRGFPRDALFFWKPTAVAAVLPVAEAALRTPQGEGGLPDEALVVDVASVFEAVYAPAYAYRAKYESHYPPPNSAQGASIPGPGWLCSNKRLSLLLAVTEHMRVLLEAEGAAAQGPAAAADRGASELLGSLAACVMAGYSDRLADVAEKEPAAADAGGSGAEQQPGSRERVRLLSDSTVFLRKVNTTLTAAGHSDLAVALAERFRDFETLIATCVDQDREYTSQGRVNPKRLDAYLVRFSADGIVASLCDYYVHEGLSHKILAQDARFNSQVEEYVSAHPHLHWIHLLQNKQFAEAAGLLHSFGRARPLRSERKTLLSLARLCCSAADVDVSLLRRIDSDIYLVTTQELVLGGGAGEAALEPGALIGAILRESRPGDPTSDDVVLALEVLGKAREQMCGLGRDGEDKYREYVAQIWRSAIQANAWAQLAHSHAEGLIDDRGLEEAMRESVFVAASCEVGGIPRETLEQVLELIPGTRVNEGDVVLRRLIVQAASISMQQGMPAASAMDAD